MPAPVNAVQGNGFEVPILKTLPHREPGTTFPRILDHVSVSPRDRNSEGLLRRLACGWKGENICAEVLQAEPWAEGRSLQLPSVLLRTACRGAAAQARAWERQRSA